MNKEVIIISNEIDDLRRENIFQEWKLQKGRNSLLFIVKLNYLELKKSLEKFINKTQDLHYSDRILIHRFHNILSQKFFNFILSAQNYFEISNSFDFNSEMICFFKELRNYMAHREMLPKISILNLHDDNKERFESFKKEGFSQYLNEMIIEHPRREGLRKARLFLNKLDEKPNMKILFENYYKFIENEFNKSYKNFISENKELLIHLIYENEIIEKKILQLNIITIGLVPPLSKSEIRLLNYLINKY